MQSTRYSFQTLIKLEFSHHILEKNSQISNFIKISVVGSEFFHAVGPTDGQADRQT